MRDRLKRRKKEPEKSSSSSSSGEAQLAPLQPAFYGLQPGEDASAETAEKSVAEPGEAEDEAGDAEATSAPGATAANGDAKKKRRRRGRGGRGRSRTRSASSGTKAAAVPAGVEENGSAEAAPALQDAPTPVAPAAPAPVVAPPAVPRASKGVVVLAIGMPGSGKSSWFKRHQITPLSSDLLRSLLFDNPTEQRFQDLIFSNLRSMLKARLIARRPMNYVDATNLTSHDRHGWIKLAKDYGYEVQAVYFDVPLETCLERNRKRDRVVPEDVMRRMANKMKVPTFEEGFSKITVVRVKQKENVEA